MINAILEGKKATGSQGSFTNKTVWTCFYACSLCTIFFFFRIYNSVCNFDRNKNKNLLKERRSKFRTFNSTVHGTFSGTFSDGTFSVLFCNPLFHTWQFIKNWL